MATASGFSPGLADTANWLWKKLSMAFFHEEEPRKSQGISRPRPPHPAVDDFINGLLSGSGGEQSLPRGGPPCRARRPDSGCPASRSVLPNELRRVSTDSRRLRRVWTKPAAVGGGDRRPPKPFGVSGRCPRGLFVARHHGRRHEWLLPRTVRSHPTSAYRGLEGDTSLVAGRGYTERSSSVRRPSRLPFSVGQTVATATWNIL
jgi:hypothetical protein